MIANYQETNRLRELIKNRRNRRSKKDRRNIKNRKNRKSQVKMNKKR